MAGIEEFDAPQGRQGKTRNGLPVLATIVSAQHNALSLVRVWLRPPADNPAVSVIQETDTFQATSDRTVLQTPVSSSVVRLPDYAAVSHGPATFRVDKTHVAQLSVRQQLHRNRVGIGKGSHSARCRDRQRKKC
jgi:hypothetical protein